MNTNKIAVKVDDLTVAYNYKPVLWDIDLEIPEGVLMAIVGPNGAGKSTLFNALTSAKALAANYPFATKDPNVGMITVPDTRLDQLASIVNPQKVLPTTIEIVDIAGLIKGASKGEGLGNQFLANIREVDAIVHVLRCFEDDDIQHVSKRAR